MGSQALLPEAPFSQKHRARRKYLPNLPKLAPVVVAGRQRETSTSVLLLMVTEFAQHTANVRGSQNLHPGGSLLLF